MNGLMQHKKKQSDCECYFAYIVVYPHCAYNELQKQDEMEDCEDTNFPVHMLTKNQKQEHQHQQRNLYFQIPLKEKTSMPKVVTGIHTSNPNWFIAYS